MAERVRRAASPGRDERHDKKVKIVSVYKHQNTIVVEVLKLEYFKPAVIIMQLSYSSYMLRCWIWICQFYCVSCLGLQQQHFVIGGWIPGTESTFLERWKPLFADYLTDAVGNLYDPPLNFTVIPVDYRLETRMTTLLSQGLLDFACEYFRNDFPQDNLYCEGNRFQSKLKGVFL